MQKTLRYLKINDIIYQNIEYDSNNPLFPTTLADWQDVARETARWLAGYKIFQVLGNNDPTKSNAAVTKSVVLLAKVISNLISANDLTFDTTTLTTNETSIWTNLLSLADNGYADSQLTLTALNSIDSSLKWYEDTITNIDNATTIDEVIDILASID